VSPQATPKLDPDSLLAARAARLAARGGAAARAEAGEEVLVCDCAGERYGLPVAGVAEVLPARPCTPIPGAPAALVGIAALSGGVVSVLDLAAALGRPSPGERPGTGHFVALRGGAAPVVLRVDRVLGLARATGADAASGYVPADGREDFVLVDLARLLRRFRP